LNFFIKFFVNYFLHTLLHFIRFEVDRNYQVSFATIPIFNNHQMTSLQRNEYYFIFCFYLTLIDKIIRVGSLRFKMDVFCSCLYALDDYLLMFNKLSFFLNRSFTLEIYHSLTIWLVTEIPS
jgi:hypothetical protein